MKALNTRLLLPLFVGALCLQSISCCSAFYCLNSCGSNNSKNGGFKLVVAVNRDEQVDRPTINADVWPAKSGNPSVKRSRNGQIDCDQSKLDPPYNLCVYGPLDFAGKKPPEYYSTWLGINERGSTGNLLFYMQDIQRNTTKGRGVMASDFLIDSSWVSAEDYMKHLMQTRYEFGPFNYVQTEMSNQTGRYSLYLITNGNNSTYQQLVSDKDPGPKFVAISNSDFERPFNKVTSGNNTFRALFDEYKTTSDKQRLVDGIFSILQNKTENYPDNTLAEFMKKDVGDLAVRGVSRLNAHYFGYWSKAHTRTSTIILVDHNDNVEYYEYNLTTYRLNGSGAVEPIEWTINSFKFKLNPLYKNDSNGIVFMRSANFILLVFATLFPLFN